VPDTTKGSTPDQQPSSEEIAALEKLEREADGMAEKAQEVEKKYDDDHGIFTK